MDTPQNKLDALKKMNTRELFAHLFEGTSWKCTTVLLLSPILLTAWKYFMSYQAMLKVIPEGFLGFQDRNQIAELMHFGLSFLVLGVIPCCIIRWVFREKWGDYGLQLGDWKHSLLLVVILVPLFGLLAYLSAPGAELKAEYPLDKLAGQSQGRFLLHALGYLFFYIGWEIYFRGFVQFGTAKSLGIWNAILVQTALSCLLHIGKPTGEIFGSIAGGILWGVISYRTQSIVSCILQHATLGIALDAFLC